MTTVERSDLFFLLEEMSLTDAAPRLGLSVEEARSLLHKHSDIKRRAPAPADFSVRAEHSTKRQLAVHYGVGPHVIQRWSEETGIAPKRIPGSRNARIETEAYIQRIDAKFPGLLEAYKGSEKLEVIGAIYGISHERVRQIAFRCGLPGREKRRRAQAEQAKEQRARKKELLSKSLQDQGLERQLSHARRVLRASHSRLNEWSDREASARLGVHWSRVTAYRHATGLPLKGRQKGVKTLSLPPSTGARCYLLRKKRGWTWESIGSHCRCSNAYQMAAAHAQKNSLPWPVAITGIQWAPGFGPDTK